MAFFNSAITTLSTLVTALGAGLGAWGVINFSEDYGNDNLGAKSQGIKHFENKDKFGKKYYSRQERKFEIYELRVLIDAISSARFITQKESNKLIKKIKSLTSKGLANKLTNQIYLDDRVVCEDKELRYNIDKLHRAVQERKIIKFKYGRYDVKKRFMESNN